MRALVEERRLFVLRLTTTNRPEPDSMACVLRRGEEPLIDEWTTPQTDLGLPGPGRGQARRDPARDARLEPHVVAFFRGLNGRLPADEPLWIELAAPKGGLIFLPWERWLTPIFERPILRLPRYALQPVQPSGHLDIAYCSSAPLAKVAVPVSELAADTAAALRRAEVAATLHVFVDAGLAAEVTRQLEDRGLGDAAVIYPADLAPTGTAEITTGGTSPLSSPWLRWMSEALSGRGVDLVHFANHGYLARGRGSLAFANTPTVNDDPAWARFVGAAELTRFLDLVGAGGLILTSPPQDFSASGLLALADEVVASRPGPVLFHDAAHDREADGLGAGLGFLLGDGAPPRAPAVTLWAHPDRLQPQDQPVAGVARDGEAPEERDEGTARGGLEALGEGGADTKGLDETQEPQELQTAEPTIETIDWRALYRSTDEPTESTGSGEMGSAQILETYTLAGKAGLPRGRRRRRGGLEELGPPRDRGGDRPKEDAAEPEAPPLWQQSSQRILERHAAKLAATKLGETDAKLSAQKGAAEALRYVAAILGDNEEDLS
jgi:hypothetical protein